MIAAMEVSKGEKIMNSSKDNNQNSTLSKGMNPTIAKENLSQLKSILDKHGIPFWLSWGTCLGAIRDRNFIAHDYDIDLSAYQQDRQRIMALIPEFESQGFKSSLGSWELYLNKDNIAIDIGFVYKTKKKLARNKQKQVGWMCDYLFLEGDFFDQLETIDFLGENYQVPQHTTAYLAYVYGSTWQTPIQKDFWWFGKRIAESNESLKLYATKENLSIIKSVFEKHNIEFWLSQKLCINAVLKDEKFQDNKEVTLNSHLEDKQKIMEIIPELNQWGFICIKASSICYTLSPTSLSIILSRQNELVEIDFALLPNLIKRLKGHKVICGQIDFSYNFFKKLKSIDFLGEKYYLPEQSRQYLDYIYSPIWQEPKFDQTSQEEKIDLLRKVLQQKAKINLVCRLPWIITRQYDNRPNNFLMEGDVLKLSSINQAIRKGMMVLVKKQDRLLMQRVIEVRVNGEIYVKSDFHGQADLVCTESDVIGQVTALHSRLGFTIPFDSKVISFIFPIIMPLLRQVRNFI